MKKTNFMRNLIYIIGGMLLVAAGVIWGLKILNIVDVDIFFAGWWTLFIIVPCFAALFSKGDKTGNLFGIFIGVTLLLAAQEVIEYNMVWKLLLPALIISVGLKWIFSGLSKKFRKDDKKFTVDKGGKHHVVVFSGSDVNYSGQVFEGAEFTAIFGGIDAHLENAVIEKDIVINAVGVFGGVDVYLPYGVNVKVSSASIFGGVDNRRHNRPTIENGPTVHINASGIFGGIEII